MIHWLDALAHKKNTQQRTPARETRAMTLILFLLACVAGAHALFENLKGVTGLLQNFTEVLQGFVQARLARQWRYYDNKTLFMSHATVDSLQLGGFDAAYDSNFIISIDGGQTFEPAVSDLVWRAGFSKPQTIYSSYGGVVGAKFGGVSNNRHIVVVQEIKSSYLSTLSTVVGRVPCDLGVCANCARLFEWNVNTMNCAGVGPITPDANARQMLCAAAFTKCIGLTGDYRESLRCSIYAAQSVRSQCALVAAVHSRCDALKVLVLQSSQQYVSEWQNLCLFEPYYESWLYFKVAFNPIRVNLAVAGGSNGDIALSVEQSCKTITSVPSDWYLGDIASITLCSSDIESSQLECPACPSGAISCARQTCQLRPGVNAFNFLGPKRITYALDVTCRCAIATPTLIITKSPAGAAAFNFPQLFGCKYTVSYKQLSVQGGDSSSYEPAGNCSGSIQFPSAFQLSGDSAGTKRSFTLVATVDAPLERESLTLSSDFFIPFESVLSIEVLTDGGSAIVRRNVSVELLLTAPQTRRRRRGSPSCRHCRRRARCRSARSLPCRSWPSPTLRAALPCASAFRRSNLRKRTRFCKP